NPTTIPNAGTYTADVTFTPDDATNYNSVSGTVDVNVLMATPTVNTWPTASDITYGDELSTSILSSGTASVPGTFTFDNPTTIPNAGTYTADVTFTPADATNYNSVSGTVDVSVLMADQTIDWTQDLTELVIGNIITLTATSSSGLNITYMSDNPEVATIIGDQLEIIGIGSAIITASQTGDANYLPADDVEKTIDVLVHSDLTKISDKIELYPIPAKNYFTLNSNTVIISFVIFDNHGKLISSIEVSDNQISYDVSSFKPGKYYLVIRLEDDKHITKSFIKM
ncbi:MAG: T9SS type A sorting domain-containing protein, partial [Bacteroidales bacterium]|nr:T9SS type A sorting domain-containing protein [Bacteroidales bacterium]